MTVHTVSTAEGLSAALSIARAGDRIELEAGDYGELKLQGFDVGGEVTITSKDSQNAAEFSEIALRHVEGLTFDDIAITMITDEDTVGWSSAIRIEDSSGITLRDSVLTGDVAKFGIDPSEPAGSQGSQGINGYPIGRAVMGIRSDDLTIEGNSITNFGSGMSFSTVDGLTVNDNEVSGIRRSPINGGDLQNVHLEGNHFHSMQPWKYGGAGDHGDHVHFWTTTDQQTPSANFTFLNNYFAQGEGQSIIGIYLDDNRNDLGFRDVLIQGNVMHNANTQGLRMEDVVGLEIRDNTFLQSEGEARDAPMIHLADGTKDVLIDGNILSGVNGPQLEDIAGNAIVFGDNIYVQIHDPLRPGFAGDLFVNALTDNPSLEDLRVVPGSAGDGYGSTAPANVAGDAAYIESQRGDGLSLNEHGFSVDGLASGAQVTWDFGDGTTASGATATHEFDGEGRYEVRATVTATDGSTEVIERTVEVLWPAPILDDFSSATSGGGVSVHMTDRGNSIRLDAEKATVTYEGVDAIRDNEAFSISIGFRKDQGAEGDGGRLLYYSGTAVVDVAADGVTLRGATSTGDLITLRAKGIGVRDDDWHQVTYTFSAEEGRAILYVDGQEVDRVDGLTGIQRVTGGHDFHVGNPYGGSIDGLIDDVAFVRATLTPEQVAEGYLAFSENRAAVYEKEAKAAGPAEEPTHGNPIEQAAGGVTEEAAEPQAASNETTEDQGVVTTAEKTDTSGTGVEETGTSGVGVEETVTVSDSIFDLARDAGGLTLDRKGGTAIDEQTGAITLDGSGGMIRLGDLGLPEVGGELSVDLTFERDGAFDGTERLLWKHGTFGVEVNDGGVSAFVRTAAGKLSRFEAEAESLTTGGEHKISVRVDDQADRIQIVVDDTVVLDDDSGARDLDLAADTPSTRDWTVGTSWNRYFDGEVSELVIDDEASFDLVGDDLSLLA